MKFITELHRFFMQNSGKFFKQMFGCNVRYFVIAVPIENGRELKNMHMDAFNPDLVKAAALYKDEIRSLRRSLHQYPELGLECYKTAERVASALKEAGLSVQTGVAGTGVVGILEGENPGPVIALRLDMDALPIEEQTALPYASKLPGRMHACGHDGHTAIGTGVAKTLSLLRRELNGTIKFIFQPGEENPGGAKPMIEEGALKNPDVSAIWGFHIFPELLQGTVGVNYGTMTAGNDEFTIMLKGTGGHGGHPDKTCDPILAAGYLIVAVQSIVSRNIDPAEPLVVTIAEVKAGDSFNVIPESVLIKGTIRSITSDGRALAAKRLKEILDGFTVAFGVGADLTINPGESPLVCNRELTQFSENQFLRLIGRDHTVRIERPSMGADDFAFFTDTIPGTYFRLGCLNREKAHVSMLHTPKFTFDEQILSDGMLLISQLLFNYLKADGVK